MRMLWRPVWASCSLVVLFLDVTYHFVEALSERADATHLQGSEQSSGVGNRRAAHGVGVALDAEWDGESLCFGEE